MGNVRIYMGENQKTIKARPRYALFLWVLIFFLGAGSCFPDDPPRNQILKKRVSVAEFVVKDYGSEDRKALEERLEESLLNYGWTLIVTPDGVVTTTGSVPEYQFIFKMKKYISIPRCKNDWASSCDISLVENRTGRKIIQISRNDCNGAIVQLFKDQLKVVFGDLAGSSPNPLEEAPNLIFKNKDGTREVRVQGKDRAAYIYDTNPSDKGKGPIFLLKGVISVIFETDSATGVKFFYLNTGDNTLRTYDLEGNPYEESDD
jgi:hypothetical protein